MTDVSENKARFLASSLVRDGVGETRPESANFSELHGIIGDESQYTGDTITSDDIPERDHPDNIPEQNADTTPDQGAGSPEDEQNLYGMPIPQ